ncbi:MAG: hypothetical protein ACTSX0_13295 [Promethearchaeota archaeon]
MKNFWASSAMGIGIALLLVGMFFVMVSPSLAIVIGLIPIFFGYMGLKKLREDPNAGGKPKAMIGIFMGGTLILVSLYLLIVSLF